MHGLCSDFVWLAAVSNAFFFLSHIRMCKSTDTWKSNKKKKGSRSQTVRRDESNIFFLASLSKGKKVHPFYRGFNFHLNSVCEHQPSNMSSSFILVFFFFPPHCGSQLCYSGNGSSILRGRLFLHTGVAASTSNCITLLL